MPRSRGSELPQRQSQRTPLHLKMTVCSEANALPRRQAAADRSSSKLMGEHRRSPRSPLHEIKKRGTKVADLETKLGNAQEELKKLKDQLNSAEAAKLEAEEALEKAKKQVPAITLSQSTDEPEEQEEKEKPSPPPDNLQEDANHTEPETKPEAEVSSGPSSVEAIGFEVVVSPTKLFIKEREEDDNGDSNENPKKNETFLEKEEDKETESMTEKEDVNGDSNEMVEDENEEKKVEESMQEQIQESSGEVMELKASLLEKEKEVEFLLEENAVFKRNADEEAEKLAASARSKEEELSSVKEELDESRARTEQLEQQLEVAQGEKTALESELKRLKVQTEQWRKAAEAAAAVLTGGSGEEGGLGSRRVAERCGSMDQHLLGGGGYVGWSSLVDIEDDAVSGGGGRRKSAAGIRRFGDLWRKKGHHK